MQMLKYITIGLALVLTCKSLVNAQNEVKKLIILHTNDLHGRFPGLTLSLVVIPILCLINPL